MAGRDAPVELLATLGALDAEYARWVEGDYFTAEELDAAGERLSDALRSATADLLERGTDPLAIGRALSERFPLAIDRGLVGWDLLPAPEDAGSAGLRGEGVALGTGEESLPLAADALELIDRVAPTVGRALRASVLNDWSATLPGLARVDPDAVVVAAVRCYHGRGNKGFLVLTLDQMWWLQKSLVMGSEEPLSYAMDVSTSRMNAVINAVVSGPSPGMASRSSCVSIGLDQFQMTREDETLVVSVIREMRELLARAHSEIELPSGGAPSPGGMSPVDQLKGLAELRESGILTDTEFEQKKAEILSRPW